MRFTIDEQFICDQIVHSEWSLYHKIPKDELTPEQLFKIIKGEDRCSRTHSQDHPEFTKLREELGQLGFIKIERGWWNGDRVLKPFTLNEWKFKKGNKFPSAAALKVSIDVARKFGYKNISL